ncbi:hypothetical protein PZB21_25815 [Rhizobium sp. CBK13]|uniref:hypothetical protein n=1 Tax=Rhizobium sp. CBK13 TaxID=3031399 RepID=UPI0023AEE12F|nr:hypothetical protein [Rhizobium sp. CBK13]MDE8762593.1 hypothetical protein [Rhizobium sp. CBK13]
MSSITSFVSELVRAANEVERLNAFTISRLLERAIVTIHDLRESAGIPGEGTEHDVLNDLRHAENAASELDPSDQASALLNAADMIRTLHIVLESGVEILLRPTGDKMDG